MNRMPEAHQTTRPGHDRPERGGRIACGGGCPHCDAGYKREATVSGLGIALAAAGVFLLPLLLAIGGSVVGQALGGYGSAGAAIGLAAGLTISILTGRHLRRRRSAAQGAPTDRT